MATSSELAPELPHPTRDELLSHFGDDYLSIQSLFRFCFVPGGRVSFLKELALEEDWGANDFVLLKYLAIHLRLALEQGCYVWNGEQIVMTAGRLATPTSAPVYVGVVRNSSSGEANPWVLNWVGERPSCGELPQPASLGAWPAIDPAAEVVVACDLADDDRRTRLPHLDGAPLVTRISALTGAIHWALHRGLAVRQIHGGGRGYFVPVYLTSREDVSSEPDVVAPVVAMNGRLVVRALLDPHVAYSPARACVERCEQLPNWLLDAWDRAAEPTARAAEA